MKGSVHQRLRRTAMMTVFISLTVVFGGIELQAQTAAELAGLPVDLNGAWSVQRLRDVGPCFDRDSRGLPRIACRFPQEELMLNARALAWLEFHDEPLEGKFYCLPEPIPSMLVRGLPQRIEQRQDRVTIVYDQRHHIVTRTIWTDGRPFPPPEDVAYYGHSIGRYEGNELIVETQNFTFDPSGIDTQGQVPSSWTKRLTERYSRIGSDRLRMVLTIEDPVFLKEPYTETLEYAPAQLLPESFVWVPCDVEDASVPLRMLPPKYAD